MATSVERLSSMVGAKVSIRINEGTYTGIVSKISCDPPSKVVLEKVEGVDNSGREIQLPGLITILDTEVIDFECLSLPQATRKSKPLKNTSPLPSIAEKNHNKEREPLQSKPSPSCDRKPQHGNTLQQNVTNLTHAMRLPDMEFCDRRIISFDDATEESNNLPPNGYVIIDNFGEAFNKAIALITSQAVIGFGLDGVELGRNGKLCWIMIATKDVVFLFDMKSLNCDVAFESGLKNIIESSNILKVIHDCRQASDILHHQFSVSLGNVYDTQVMDIMIYRKKTGGKMPQYVRNLSVLLMEFVGLSEAEAAFYHIRKNAVERDCAIWSQRPLPPMLCQAAALNVRYLKELRLATLATFLADFTHGVDIYLDVVRTAEHVRKIAGSGELLPEAFHKFGPVRNGQAERNGQAARNGPRESFRRTKNVHTNSVIAPYSTDLANGHATQVNRAGEPNPRFQFDLSYTPTFVKTTAAAATAPSPQLQKHDRPHHRSYDNARMPNLTPLVPDDDELVSVFQPRSSEVVYPAGMSMQTIIENARKPKNPSPNHY